MTRLLEEAFKKASVLPAPMQDLLAREVMDEIVWEMKWDKELENSSDVLDDMAEKALREFQNGKTEQKGLSE